MTKKNLIALMLCILSTISSCSLGKYDNEMKQLITAVNEIKAISQSDSGYFWKIPFLSPLLFVNPANRQAYAFELGKKPYSIFLNDTIPIANTAIKWEDNLWAMVQTPLPKQSFEHEKLILHEMFHVLQPRLGFDSLVEFPCAHLEQKDARILLRLELQSLLKALQQSNNKDSMYYHLANAFSFKNSRYMMYPGSKQNENNLELNEGIAEYTALMMVQRYSKNKLNDSKLIAYFNGRISDFEKKSFTRSFAYETIPLYGFLIQKYVPDWHHEITAHTNLMDFFMQKTNINFTEEVVDQLYNNEVVINEENIRLEQVATITNYIKEKFQCNNHVEIPLFQYNISFDPQNIFVIESIGELHVQATIIDVWGKLDVSKGLILDKNKNKILLSPILKINNNIAFGDGWELVLNEGWEINDSKKGWMELKNK